MKKVLSLFIVLIILLSNVNVVSNADEMTNLINDETSIKADILNLGLVYEDYIVSEEAYNKLVETYETNNVLKNYVIAVAEAYNHHSLITTYIYVYNPIMYYGDINIGFSISYNGCKPYEYLYNTVYKDIEIVKEDVEAGIVCFKTQFFRKEDTKRNYSIEIDDMPVFECTYETDSSGINRQEFNFNSFIFIEDDILLRVEFVDWDTNSFWQSFFRKLNIFEDDDLIEMYFYNFSCNKEIDKIISAHVVYEEYDYVRTYYLDPETETELKTLNSSRENYQKVPRTLEPKITTQKVYGVDCTFNTFVTPASKRLEEFGKSVSLDKDLFDYEHSIFINCGLDDEIYSTLKWIPKTDIWPSLCGDSSIWSTSRSTLMTVLEIKSALYTIEQLELTALEYEHEGVLYSAYVSDPSGPNEPVPVLPDNPKNFWQSIWEILIKIGRFVLEDVFQFSSNELINDLFSIDILYGVVGSVTCLLILILSIVFLPYIFRLLMNIITLPFKLFSGD